MEIFSRLITCRYEYMCAGDLSGSWFSRLLASGNGSVCHFSGSKPFRKVRTS